MSYSWKLTLIVLKYGHCSPIHFAIFDKQININGVIQCLV